MLQITPKHKIFLSVDHIDFRNGIDGIVSLCRKQLQQDPYSGHCFIFRNRTKKSIKILVYDGQGFWLSQKRLSTGSFKAWPKSPHAILSLTAAQLQVLFYNGDPATVQTSEQWLKLD